MNYRLFNGFLSSVTEQGRKWVAGKPGQINNDKQLQEAINSLISQRGEASGMLLGQGIFDYYENTTDAQKITLFDYLANELGPDHERLRHAVQQYFSDPTSRRAQVIHDATESRFQELLRRLNHVPEGTAKLVTMRADLRRLKLGTREFAFLDRDFYRLLSAWFNRGFLVLQDINWSTPANVLEKIIAYEAVHQIDKWSDLRLRIEPTDRFCYGFFHPVMEDEPLIFVEVALLKEVPNAIAPILDAERERINAKAATTAAFYSISNCQQGLRGVSFGNFLIKQVVDHLQKTFPNVKQFVTLSPIPNLRKWVDETLDQEDDEVLSLAEQERLQFINRQLSGVLEASRDTDAGTGDDQGALESPEDDMALPLNEEQQRAVLAEHQTFLLHVAAKYFLYAKRRKQPPYDSVANFHLGNGAQLLAIHGLANGNAQGVEQSYGMMVNYQYDLTKIEKNHELFASERRIIAAPEIKKLIKKSSIDMDD